MACICRHPRAGACTRLSGIPEYSPRSSLGTLATSKNLTPKGAWQKLKSWMMIRSAFRTLATSKNSRLWEAFSCKSDGAGLRSFTPKQVQMIVDELGEP
ncbi:MAG: hypothetical protein IKQ59_12250 [Prevotella sp.]|nr:hypothetical protein [Prevotella sp.]MBR6189701.1 hypothetical protein [Prevotella sp.]